MQQMKEKYVLKSTNFKLTLSNKMRKMLKVKLNVVILKKFVIIPFPKKKCIYFYLILIQFSKGKKYGHPS